MSDDAMPPRKPGRMKGPGKRKNENGNGESVAETAAESAEAGSGETPHGAGPRPPKQFKGGRPGKHGRGAPPESPGPNQPKLQLPTRPVEVSAETKEEEAAAAAAAATGKPALTVNIAKLQAMSMTEL